MEALLPRFQAAHTQVLGVSIDSVYCHANWGQDLGGISFPLLADFQPKGAMAASYGVYLDAAGITDRATVIIDSGGVVRYAHSVTPAGKRDMAELAALCEGIDADSDTGTEDFTKAPGLAADPVLYVKNACGFSRAALLARDNLHLADQLPVKNVSESEEAKAELERRGGKDQAPCLVMGGEALFESADIIRTLVERTTPGV